MNLEKTDEEQLLHDACATLFQRHAGIERARSLTESGDTDVELMKALSEAGMLDLALDPDIGPIGAQFVSEWASESAAAAPVGWRCLVAPHVISGDVPPIVAIDWGGSGSLCRYADDADVLLSVNGDEVILSRRGEWNATTVPSRYGFPLSTVDILGGEPLGETAVDTLNRWARVSLATEIAGAGRSAIQLTVQYVKDREQFGRALGTYQTIQHRLAEDFVSIEALSLLAKEAAFFGAPAEKAAAASTYACDIAHRVFTDAHQFTGAMGFAKEYDLYLWSMKIQFLAQEAGGLSASTGALCDARWGSQLTRSSLLTCARKRGVTVSWRDDRSALREEWRQQGWHGDDAIGVFIQRAAEQYPATLYHWDTPDGLKSASLGEIYEASRRFANALVAMGLGSNEVVASQLPNSFEATVSICGVFMAGLTLLPMASSTGPADQRRALEDSGARVVIVPGLWRGRTLAERMGEVFDGLDIVCICVEPDGSRDGVVDWSQFCAPVADRPLPEIDADSRAVLLYTSGSTAAPKAVQHSHNSMLVAARGTTIPDLRFQPDFKYFIPSPVSHMAGVMFTLRPLITAAPMLTVDTWSPERAFELCEQYQPDRMNASTFFFLSLFDYELSVGAVGGWPKSFNTGGATVPPSMIQTADEQSRHGWRSYGSSEIPASNAGNPLEPLYKRSLTDGRTQMGSEIKIVDDDEVGVPIGEVGEVFARGPQMFIGYVDEDANDTAFAPGGWFRTGDLGRLDFGGYLTIVGRKKDIVIRGGENLSTKEVEDVLAQHSMILEVACLPVPDAIYGERMCAVVRVKSDRSNITLEEVRTFFKERGISRRKTPEVLAVYGDDWPRTSYGKVIKSDLLARLIERGVLVNVDGSVSAGGCTEN